MLSSAGVGVLLHKDPDSQIFVADIVPGGCMVGNMCKQIDGGMQWSDTSETCSLIVSCGVPRPSGTGLAAEKSGRIQLGDILVLGMAPHVAPACLGLRWRCWGCDACDEAGGCCARLVP